MLKRKPKTTEAPAAQDPKDLLTSYRAAVEALEAPNCRPALQEIDQQRKALESQRQGLLHSDGEPMAIGCELAAIAAALDSDLWSNRRRQILARHGREYIAHIEAARQLAEKYLSKAEKWFSQAENAALVYISEQTGKTLKAVAEAMPGIAAPYSESAPLAELARAAELAREVKRTSRKRIGHDERAERALAVIGAADYPDAESVQQAFASLKGIAI